MYELKKLNLARIFKDKAAPLQSLGDHIDGHIQFYTDLQNEVLDNIEYFQGTPVRQSQKRLPLFIYALRDLADQGVIVLEVTAEVKRSSFIDREDERNLSEFIQTVHNNIAAARNYIDIIKKENPGLEIVPSPTESFSP